MKVDTYQRQEKLDPIRGSHLSAPEDVAFKYVASGLNDWASLSAKWKEEADKTVISEAQSKYIRMQQDRDFGENGYFKQKGMHAVTSLEKREYGMSEDIDKVTKDMNSQQLAMFNEWVTRYNDNQRNGFMRYASGEAVSHANKEALSLAQTNLENAAANYNNPAMFTQATEDYDQSVLRVANLQGLEGEARARFIANERGKMTATVVSRMLQNNPDNPWAAKQYYEKAKNEGRADLEACTKIDNVLRPAIDAATVRSLAAKFGKEIDDANVKENETNPDNPRDKTASIINRIMDDTSIPLRLRSHIAQAATARAKYAQAARDEEYANLHSQVQEKLRNNPQLTVWEIPEAAHLKAKDREKLAQGVVEHSDPDVIYGFITRPETVTVENVNANASKLSNSDKNTWLSRAVHQEQSVKQGNADLQVAIEKAKGDEKILEIALLDQGREKDLKDPEFKKTKEWKYTTIAFNQLTRQWMTENKRTTVPEETARQLANEAWKSVRKETWWGLSSKEVGQAVVFEQEKGYSYRGEESDYLPVDELILTNTQGKKLDNSDVIKKQIIDELKKAGQAVTSGNIIKVFRERESKVITP